VAHRAGPLTAADAGARADFVGGGADDAEAVNPPLLFREPPTYTTIRFGKVDRSREADFTTCPVATRRLPKTGIQAVSKPRTVGLPRSTNSASLARVVPPREQPLPANTAIWTLEKDDRCVEARVRSTPIGMELRFFIYNADEREGVWLLWSPIFRPQDGGTAALHDEALLKRREFEVRGWREVNSEGDEPTQ
jgi:hypothetical protein